MASLPLMPFLRPLPLPRVASIQFLRRRISTQPHLLQQVATSAPKSAAFPSPTNSSSTQTPSTDPLQPLPYHVHRTASQKLPIYHIAKRGGNLHQTRIRKIEGDVERLRDEIRTALGLRDELVVINRLTGHIIIKGWYRDDIKRFLEDRLF